MGIATTCSAQRRALDDVFAAMGSLGSRSQRERDLCYAFAFGAEHMAMVLGGDRLSARRDMEAMLSVVGRSSASAALHDAVEAALDAFASAVRDGR